MYIHTGQRRTTSGPKKGNTSLILQGSGFRMTPTTVIDLDLPPPWSQSRKVLPSLVSILSEEWHTAGLAAFVSAGTTGTTGTTVFSAGITGTEISGTCPTLTNIYIFPEKIRLCY